MEISTEENGQRVSTVYERALEAVHAGEQISEQENFVYQLELLSQEVNSGASFEQYFRWVGKPELDTILYHVKQLELPEVYSVVEQAIRVAFPNGVPEDEDAYEESIGRLAARSRRIEHLATRFGPMKSVGLALL